MAKTPSMRDGCRLRLFRPTPHSKIREPLVFSVSPNFSHDNQACRWCHRIAFQGEIQSTGQWFLVYKGFDDKGFDEFRKQFIWKIGSGSRWATNCTLREVRNNWYKVSQRAPKQAPNFIRAASSRWGRAFRYSEWLTWFDQHSESFRDIHQLSIEFQQKA